MGKNLRMGFCDRDKDGKQVGKRLCGRPDKPTVTIPGDLAIVELKSDDAVNEKGFEARYVAEAPPPSPEPGHCSFDKGLCPGLTNVNHNTDDFDWTIRSGSTPTLLTGPKTDHSGKGKYLYIESTGRSVGDKALMTTAEMLGGQCLTFFYHMYGIVGMGSLQVNIVTNSGKRLVMKLSGNQGDEWKEAQVQIREDALYWVVFEGIVGQSDYSDIAIDDINFSRALCKARKDTCRSVLTATSGTFTSPGYPNNYPDNLRCEWIIRPATTTSIIVITFTSFQLEMEPECRDDYVIVSDSNGRPVKKSRFCGFYGNGFGVKVRGNEAGVYFHSNGHLTDKGFQVSYKTIPTTSPGDCDFDDGLCPAWANAVNDDFDWSIGKDKTQSFFTGPDSDIYIIGNYAYIEASGRRPGAKAVLVSGPIGGPKCLTFSYNMNGQQMGSLIVSVKHNQDSRVVWDTTGDHGKFWMKESIDVDGGQLYEVVFEGIVGESFTSDIAIDEISLTNGRCPPKTGNTHVRAKNQGETDGLDAYCVFTLAGCSKIMTGATGSFHSPNFPSPYPTGVDCTWTIIPPPHYVDVAITFHHVDIEKSSQCSKDYIAVEDTTGTPKGPKLCGASSGDKTVEVDWHQSYIHFHSDSSVVGKGFQASYRSFGPLPVCGGQLSGNKGSFSSPNYPNNYPNRVTCDWEITGPKEAKRITIKFEDFAIDDSPVMCFYDYLLVFNAQHGREVGRFCGMHKPLPIKIDGNVVNVRFQSSHLHVARGFKAYFSVV
ncbi:hypothetical protein QZH41_011133 [Actinostola sp. cb2023]|nr:hypothetical protein QZH41_011133 [Actinostola sp. cb2023]